MQTNRRGYPPSVARALEATLCQGLPALARQENAAAGLRGMLPQSALGGAATRTADERDRAMNALLAVLSQRSPMGVTELAKSIDRSVSTTHQYLRALAAEGCLESIVTPRGSVVHFKQERRS